LVLPMPQKNRPQKNHHKKINCQVQLLGAEWFCRCLISRIVHQHGREPICVKRILTLRARATLFPCSWHQRLPSSRGDGPARLTYVNLAFLLLWLFIQPIQGYENQIRIPQ
jgi:hypothetical protein